MTFFSSLKNRFRKQPPLPQEEMPPAMAYSFEEDLPPPMPADLLEDDSSTKFDRNNFFEVPPPLPSRPPLPLVSEDLENKLSPSFSSKASETAPSSSLKNHAGVLGIQLRHFYQKIFSWSTQQQTGAFFAKLRYQITSVKKVSATRDLLVLRPAETKGTWELWKYPFKKGAGKEIPSEEEAVLLNEHALPVLPASATRLMVGVPTRDLIVIPLWISSEGNQLELIELELASKHLLRRGMAEGLKTIPLETKEGRTLVIVLAPTSTASAATAPYLKHADQFEANARFLPQQGADLIIWRELGEICFGFSKNQEFVWFSGSSEPVMTPSVIGLIKRMALRLQAESVLQEMPRHYCVVGSFSQEELTLLNNSVTPEVSITSTNYIPSLPSPILPAPSLDLPNEEARQERLHQEKKLRIKRIAAMASMFYLFLLLLAGGTLLVHKSKLHYFERQIVSKKAAVNQANETMAEWQEFRPAIDPTTYTLDILSAIARQIHGEKIRLITLAGIAGRLQVTGEATDVAQAYHFIEQIKKAPELQEYSWTSGQPKLAGKNSVRFELEGSRPNAKTSTE